MVPEVISTITHHSVLSVPGVTQLSEPPSTSIFRRSSTKKDGIILEMVDEERLKFEIYIRIQSDVNMVETCKSVQTAIIEAIDQLVGLPVDTVNVHVTDVTHQSNEAV